MGVIVLRLIWPLAFLLCFAVQANISPEQGLIPTAVALPITLIQRAVPSQWNLVYIFAGLGTLVFALIETHLLLEEFRKIPSSKK